MNEKELKDALVKQIRASLPAALVFRHEDQNTAGIPDISVTYKGLTQWLEVKYANPTVHSRGLQLVTCTRLHEVGICHLVIYEEKKGVKQTIIAEPKVRVEQIVAPDECMTPGFDHNFVVMFIRRVCGDNE